MFRIKAKIVWATNHLSGSYPRKWGRRLTKMASETMQPGLTTLRGSEAIREIFQLSRAFGSIWRGLTELTGLARLFRRGAEPSFVKTAFEHHKTFEPVAQLPEIVNKLGPRLEGRDLQDLD